MNTWSGEVEVLAVGTDGTLYRNHLNSSGWQGWNQDFGTAPAPQVAVLNAIGIGLGNNNEAFAVGTDGTLYHNTTTTGPASGRTGVPTSEPAPP